MVPMIGSNTFFDQLYHLAFHFGALNGGLHRLEFRHGNITPVPGFRHPSDVLSMAAKFDWS